MKIVEKMNQIIQLCNYPLILKKILIEIKTNQKFFIHIQI